MSSSIPKPPQRIRVEMPASIVPQPLPDTAMPAPEDAAATSPAGRTGGTTIHIMHPAAPAPEAIPDEPLDALPPPAPQTLPADAVLFGRQYYSIGEVAAMFGANPSQIRFWENEFDILQPRKNRKGDRFFRPEDVKNIELIRHLLQERRFTIEGAKDYLKRQGNRASSRHEAVQALEKLRGFLLELKSTLGK